MINYSDLIEKDIISLQSGENIGQFDDAEIDVQKGRITALYIEEGGRILGVLGKNRVRRINWKDIIKIGIDVIIVNIESKNTKENNKDIK